MTRLLILALYRLTLPFMYAFAFVSLMLDEIRAYRIRRMMLDDFRAVLDDCAAGLAATPPLLSVSEEWIDELEAKVTR